MIIYYLSRSSIITLLIIIVWSIANIFVNVPPDFNKYKGDIIYKECIAKDTIWFDTNHNVIRNIKYHYNFTYLTKSGHAITVNDYVYEHNDYNFESFKKNQFYKTNGYIITIFTLLLIFGITGTLITLANIGIDNIDQMIYGNRQKKINVRNMRFNHYKLLIDFFGYPDEETREITYKAIELAKNNSSYLNSIKNGYAIKIPNMSEISKMVDDNVKRLIKEKQEKNNITNE